MALLEMLRDSLMCRGQSGVVSAVCRAVSQSGIHPPAQTQARAGETTSTGNNEDLC